MTTSAVDNIRQYVYGQLDHLYDTLKQNARSDPRVDELKWVLDELKGWDGTSQPSRKLDSWLERHGTEFEDGALVSTERSESESELFIAPAPLSAKALPAPITASQNVLELVIKQVQSDDPDAWRDAIVTLQALKEGAEGEKQIELDQWLRQAQRQHQQEIERLYDSARREWNRDRQRELYNRILKFSFVPDKERANDLLSALEAHERKEEEADAKRRLLARIVDRLEKPRGRIVTTKELHHLLNDIKRLFSEEEQHEDEELAVQIRRVQEAYNRLREAEGEIVTRTNLGQHADALKKLDDLVNQGITQLPSPGGNLIDILVRRRNIVNDYRTFVHNKIAEKRALADNEWLPANPGQALELLKESKALYEAMVHDIGGSIAEDRQLEADLDLHIQRVQLQVNNRKKAQALIEKANEERSLRKRLTYLRQAQVEFDHFPNIKALIARAEERLGNQVAAEIENDLKKISREAVLTSDFNKIARLQTQVEQLYQKGIADGVTSRALQEALQEQERVQNYLMARVDFLQRVKEIRSALQQPPLALSSVQQNVEVLTTSYPEEAYPHFVPEIRGLQVQINRLGDEEPKLVAARQALELGDPDEALKILRGVSRSEAIPLRKQARIAQNFRQAANDRLQGNFAQARARYDEIERLPNLDLQIKTQIQKERRQTRIEEQNRERRRRKVKLAQRFWEKGNRVSACQELKEAANMAGAGAEIRDLLDHYLEAWRFETLQKFKSWLVEVYSAGWQEMQMLVQQARHHQLLLNEEDRRLADDVYIRCRGMWAFEVSIEGSEEQMRALLEELEQLSYEVTGLSNSIDYLYRLAQVSLFLAQYDQAKEYSVKCLLLLKREAPTALSSPLTAVTHADVKALQQEIITRIEIDQMYSEIESQLDNHERIDRSFIRHVEQLQKQVGNLQLTYLSQQNMLDDLIERTVQGLIEQRKGKEKDQNRVTIENLQVHYWAWSLLASRNPMANGLPVDKGRHQSKLSQLQNRVAEYSDELPHLIQVHLALIEQFEQRLTLREQRIRVEDARKEVVILKEQGEALHHVLQQVNDERIKPSDKKEIESKWHDLINIERNLATLEQKIKRVFTLYEQALRRGDFNTERLFGPIEAELRQIKEQCEHTGLCLREVEQLETCLYRDIGQQVFLPLDKSTQYCWGEALQEESIMLPSLDGGRVAYKMRLVTIGDIALHRLVVRLVELLQDAWLDEKFDLFESIYRQFLQKIDPEDRYTLHCKADLFEYSYDGTSHVTKYHNLRDVYPRVLKKIDNLKAWQKFSALRTREHAILTKEWPKIEYKTRSHVPETSRTVFLVIENRQSLLESWLNQVEALLDDDPTKPASSRSVPKDVLSEEAARLKQESQKVAKDMAGYHYLLLERSQQLKKALEQRTLLLNKLKKQIPMEARESTEQIIETLQELDPNHPTVKRYIHQKRTRSGWKRWFKR